MTLLLDSIFSSVAFAHLFVDILNGQRAVLLAYLSGPMGLSNATLGLVSTLYVVSAAMIGPFFGYLTDRVGSRWVVSGGVLWMGIFFTLALIVQGPASLVLLILASLGSGAYHPAGTMQATLRGRTRLSGKETTATSYFFLFGQLGHFMGPLLGGPLLDTFGVLGLLVLVVPIFPTGLFTARNLASIPVLHPGASVSSLSSVFDRRLLTKPLLAFALLAAFQSWAQQNMVTFVPKYLSDMGYTPSLYGVIAAFFMGGSAFGNVAGGILADRFGKQRVAMIALTLASIPLALVPSARHPVWLFVLIPIAGALTGATHSIIVVLAQRMIPGGMALASALILGFMFSSGAIGTYFSGYLADLAGFVPVFHMTGLIALTAGLLTLVIKEQKPLPAAGSESL